MDWLYSIYCKQKKLQTSGGGVSLTGENLIFIKLFDGKELELFSNQKFMSIIQQELI